MTPKELYKMLKTLGMPVAYFKFNEKKPLPFLVYLQTGTDTFIADEKVYTKEKSFAIEYYFSVKDEEKEEQLEQLLTKTNIKWERTEDVYIPEENIFMTTYYI